MNVYESDAVQDCDLEPRTVRALTEGILVVEARADDRYFVYGESGNEYVVNNTSEECSCPDHQSRGVQCKHLRRVAFETGRETVPPVLDRDALAEFLVAALEARETGRVAADGGEVLGHQAHRERQQEAASDVLTSVERADALGLDHAGGCTDDDPVTNLLRCWRCYYLDARCVETGGEGDHDE